MNKDVSKPYERFWALLKPDSKDISDIYLFAIIGGLLSLGLPLGIQAIINFIQAGKVSTSWFLLVGLVVSAIGFSGYMNIAQLRITENLQQRIFTRSALEFATRIPKFSCANSYCAMRQNGPTAFLTPSPFKKEFPSCSLISQRHPYKFYLGSSCCHFTIHFSSSLALPSSCYSFLFLE